MRKLIFALAAGIVAATASIASASPAANAARIGHAIDKTNGVAVEHVYDGDRRRMLRKQNRHNGGHWKHRRHSDYSQYRGWNRYSYRPRGWRNRNCVSVGPIWFCP
ncbi:MAG: hypothetical protein ABL907_26335 [Hyphomicrobium sp.]